MKIVILLGFTICSALVIGCVGAPASNKDTPNRAGAVTRKPNQDQPETKPRTSRTGSQRSTIRPPDPRGPVNAKMQGPRPNSPAKNNPGVVRSQSPKQQVGPTARQVAKPGTRQIEGIPAGPPDSDIDDKVVIDVPEGSTVPTVIPPVDPSPTAPQQNTDETPEPTTEPPTEPPTEPATEKPPGQTTTTIAPQTTTTIAPQTTTTIAPQTTSTISPQTTSTISPQTTSTISPQTTSTISPQTTSTISPQTTTTIGPQTTTTIAPQTTTTIAPQTTTTIAPQTTTTIAPPTTPKPPPPPPPPPTKPPCVPVPPQKSSVVYVPRPVVRYGYFQRAPPVRTPPPVVVVNNEVSPGVTCPASGEQQAAPKASAPSTSYGPNMIIINNPKGAPQVPSMVFNHGRPPPIVNG